MLTSLVRKAGAALRWRMKMVALGFTVKRMAGAEEPPAGDPPPPATPPTNPPPADPPKTFNKADVDRIVQERLARDRKDRPSDEEIEAMRAKAAKHDELEAASKTELEQAQERAETAERSAAEATTKANQTLRKAAIVTAAAEAGADPEIVHALLAERNFKVTHEEKDFEVAVGDDGQVTGAADAVKAIVALKNIVGQPTPPGPGDGGARQTVTPPDLEQQIRDAEKAGDFQTAMSLKSRKLAAKAVEASGAK